MDTAFLQNATGAKKFHGFVHIKKRNYIKRFDLIHLQLDKAHKAGRAEVEPNHTPHARLA